MRLMREPAADGFSKKASAEWLKLELVGNVNH